MWKNQQHSRLIFHGATGPSTEGRQRLSRDGKPLDPPVTVDGGINADIVGSRSNVNGGRFFAREQGWSEADIDELFAPNLQFVTDATDAVLYVAELSEIELPDEVLFVDQDERGTAARRGRGGKSNDKKD